jgi:hypothetical protein
MTDVPANVCPVCGRRLEAAANASEMSQCGGCLESLCWSEAGGWVARVDGWIRLEMGANDPLVQSLLVLLGQLPVNNRLKFHIRLGLEEALVDTLKRGDFGDAVERARLKCVISTAEVRLSLDGLERRFER